MPETPSRPGGRTADEQSVFERVRTLNRLRAELVALRQGTTVDLLVEEQVYAFARATREDSAIVAFNNGGEAATLDFSSFGLGLGEGETLDGSPGRGAGDHGRGRAPALHVAAAVRRGPHPAALTIQNCRKPSSVQDATRGRFFSSVRSSISGVTETRFSRSTTLQSLPGMSSCWYSLPPIQ